MQPNSIPQAITWTILSSTGIIGRLLFIVALWLILTENNVAITKPIIACYLVSVLLEIVSGVFTAWLGNEAQRRLTQVHLEGLEAQEEQMERYNEQSKALVEEVRLYIDESRREKDLEFINKEL